MTTTKDTNPKDIVGVKKVPTSGVSEAVTMEVGLALLEGARKYGRHNWREAGVVASVYRDAARRHMASWWEGQDIDPASKIHHIGKAIASLTVLRDAMMCGTWVDDRPPARLPEGWMEAMDKQAAEIVALYPNPKEPFTEKHIGRQETTPEEHSIYGTPDADGWYPWQTGNGDRPPNHRKVEIRLRNGLIGGMISGEVRWHHDPKNSVGDVVAWRFYKE